eukprot:scaffold7214_cov152-Skeletonema_menzelii.AAC.9
MEVYGWWSLVWYHKIDRGGTHEVRAGLSHQYQRKDEGVKSKSQNHGGGKSKINMSCVFTMTDRRSSAAI